ncbi:MAG: uL15 family ribosomal protein, partial [Clostridia bacterium]|nr:uL15 family ribosomal protein [Clostridia bacterium]
DDDDEEEDEDEDDDGSQDAVDGEVVGGEKVYRPKYTYPVKLKLSNDTVKGFYTDLKNEFLSYGIKSRISKTKENFNFSRDNIARLCIRGKTMKLYIALDPNELDNSYFHHKDAGEKKTYAEIPTMVRIKSRKSVAKSKELIAMLAEKLELKKKRRFQPKDFSEDLSPVGLTYIEKKGYGYLMKGQSVALETAEQLPDELSARFVQKSEGRLVSRYIKTSVTLGELSSRFNDGDTVNIDAIKASGIGSKNANYLIVEDGQSIDKKLKVYADEFSPNAIKMIALAGGEAFKIDRK